MEHGDSEGYPNLVLPHGLGLGGNSAFEWQVCVQVPSSSMHICLHTYICPSWSALDPHTYIYLHVACSSCGDVTLSALKILLISIFLGMAQSALKILREVRAELEASFT